MDLTRNPKAPRVFLSYSSDDVSWVETFSDPRWFGGQLGNVVVEDYRDADNLDFGPLGEWIDERTEQAAVMVAFVSQSYMGSKYSLREWKAGLDVRERRKRLVFVPVMLDADAKKWWRDAKEEGRLRELPTDYQFADFTRNGKREDIDAKNDTVITGKITRLAHAIRDLLRSPAPAVGPADARPAQAAAAASRVVLLGHPTSTMPAEVKQDAAALAGLLAARGLAAETWDDGWEDTPPAAAAAPPGMFVRPLTEQEAASHAKDSGQTADQLKAVGHDDAPVTLWLPSPRTDKRFKAATTAWLPQDRPALRMDAPAELADWLCGTLVPGDAVDDLILQIEDLGGADGAVPDPQARRLADELQAVITTVVGMEVTPRPTSWTFMGSMFRKQVAKLPQRSIVVLHDLTITPTDNYKMALAAITRKFQEVQEELGKANRHLDVFKMAVVFNTADALPFSGFPPDGLWKDWRLLSLEPAGEAAAPGEPPPLCPDPASLGVLRSHLRAWAARR